MKKTLLISSLVVIVVLAAEAYRENHNMAWQRYQKKYKAELTRLAKTDQERKTADNFRIRMQQIVLPRFGREDRCITCHVAMEDARMSDMPNPLKSHPGDYLDTHDVNRVGCTLCHDGQGRAITAGDAHARGGDKYWEKPILTAPFLESNCVRCHADTLAQTTHYNQGKELVRLRGCVACHKIEGKGGAVGPDLTNIGNASFHVKVPTEENREALLGRFHDNVNLAYIYEAVTDPKAQSAETKMPDFGFSEQEATALLVYLKSLTSQRRVMDVGLEPPASPPIPEIAIAVQEPPSLLAGKAATPTALPSKGYTVFSTRCIACHTIGQGKRVGPDLKGVAARRNREWMKKFIQVPSVMFNDMDPIATKLLQEYKTPMTDLGLTDAEVEEVVKFLENPVVPVQVVSAVSSAVQPAQDAAAIGARATRADIAKGRDLFQGKWRLLNGGPSCISCHHVRNDAVVGGGNLAKELTTVFSRMGDAGIQAILDAPPFPVMQQAYRNRPLTKDEIFALVSFLEESDKEHAFQQARGDYGMKLFGSGVAGVVVLLGSYTVFWHRRKKGPVNRDVYDRQIQSE